MATIGIYDYDFMHYAPVIPNLECAKLSRYYKSKKELTILTSELNPEVYTKFYIRKDYEDGVYPDSIFSSNVVYGGRAFSSDNYVPMELDIEIQKPDFSGYQKYNKAFQDTKKNQMLFTKLMRAQHLRLSLDGKTLWNSFERQLEITNQTRVLILHDYDVGQIDGAIPVMKELIKDTTSEGKDKPRMIGMKFPVRISSTKHLEEWINFYPSLDIFNMEYRGIIEDELIWELGKTRNPILKQLIYNVTAEWQDENHFLEYQLPQIYKQLLVLKSHNIEFSLIYDDKIKMSLQLKNLLRLLQQFAKRPQFKTKGWNGNTLYKFVSTDKYKNADYFYGTPVPLEDVRESFQYIREKNYELFKLFYECECPVLEGGKLIG